MSSVVDHARHRVPRIAGAAVERARLSVVPRTAGRVARMPFVALVSLLLVSGVAGLLLFNTNMQQDSFTATALQDKATALQARQQGLQMRLDGLRDPQRVAERAKRMGMVPATSPAFIQLSDGKILGHPTAAGPANAMRITPLPVGKPRDLRTRIVIVQAAGTRGGASGVPSGSDVTSASTKKQRATTTNDTTPNTTSNTTASGSSR